MHSQKKKDKSYYQKKNFKKVSNEAPQPKRYRQKREHEINDSRYTQSQMSESTHQSRYKSKNQEKYPHQAQSYPHKDLKQGKDKLSVSNIPNHILDCSTMIDEEELGVKVETRYIRKYFLEKFADASKSQLTIRRATYFPCIFFEYIDSSRRVVSVDFKDLVRSNKKSFQEKPELVSVLFNQLYQRVEPKFFKLALFAVKIAKERNVPISTASIFKQQNIQIELMFYYSLSKKKDIHFTLIDKYLNFIYFRTDNIHKLRQELPEEFDLFMRFEQNVVRKKIKSSDDRWDILENQEIQFNEKDIQYIGQSTAQLQKKYETKLQEIKLSLTSEYMQELNEKQNLLKQMQQQQESSDMLKIQKLLSEVENLSRKIKKTEKVIKEIKYQYQHLSMKDQINQWFYIKSIKKIILAEKELASKLPILQRKSQIIRMLTHSQGKPLIIEGETGSGKSTQLPQILIEFCDILDHPSTKPILVTQPRRLATRTLAERVALELGQNRPNNFVDYKNSISKDINPNAKIIFKLDRLVLDQITEDPLLDKYSCLVIDQAHERTISIDVIIGLIRNLLQKRDDFKVIITSASMDVELFERQFQTKALKVSGRLFKVDVEYKDYELENSVAKIQKVIDQQILHDQSSFKEKYKGHLLVFCSGVEEINNLTQIYTKKLNQNRFLVFPLHGKIVPEEQRKAFMPCKQHKIIFASRIAETAITIDDVRIVVDPGEDIELIYDQRYKFSSMKIRPISQSSAKQRAGRAGRTAPGFCFRLYSEKQFYQRPLGKVPEMENSSLDTVVLRLKSLGIEDVINFHYISKPDQEGLLSSIENLKMIGALSSEAHITEIGQLLILIPIEPMLSRSILEGLLVQFIVSQDEDKYQHLFEEVEEDKEGSSMVESVIQILCMIVNSSSLFHIYEQNQNQGDLKKFQQFKVNEGDFFFLRSIYRQFKDNLTQYGDKAELSFWFKEFYLSKKTLKQVRELETQILKIIRSIGKTNKLKFDSLGDQLDEIQQKLRHCKDFKDVLMACLITSFIPNLCIYSQDPLIGYTLINQKRPIAIYGTSTLSLIGLTQESPKWILSYDFYTSQKGRFYCKIAQGINFDFLKNTVNTYVWKKFNLGVIQKTDPFYEKVWENSLSTKVYSVVKNNYLKYSCGGFQMQEANLFKTSTWIFNDQNSFLKIFILKQSINSDIQNLKQMYFHYFDQIKTKLIVQDLKYAYFASAQVVFNSNFELKSMQKIIQKDILIREYVQDDSMMIKEFVWNHLSQYGIINIFPYSRNIKICLHEEKFLRVAEEQIQKFFSQNSFKQRPSFRVIPRNQRRSSQAKTILIFYVPNKLEKWQDPSQKYYNILKNFCDQENSQLQLSHKTDLEWKQQIQILLYRVDVNPQNCAINIWGNFDITHKNHELIQIRAQISSFESGIYEKLHEFQGKKRYLGCDKLYIRRSYEQIIAFPIQRIFNSLKDEYISMIIQQNKKTKDLMIIQKNAKIKNQHFFKIIGKCHNREALTRSAERIAFLFQPKMIQLTNQQIRYLTQIDRFSILDRLEHQFKYNITFDLNRFTKSLAVYCPSIFFEDIVSKLKSYLKKSQYVSNTVSYKGKNLNQVLAVLEHCKAKISQNKKGKLEYQILFTKKMINITTIPSFYHEVKQEIQNLNKVISEDCQLCSDYVKSPYILLNCNHHFCKICLSRFIKTELTNSKGAVSCPKSQCNKSINVFDIQLIIGEHLFEKIADQRVRDYAQKSDKYQVCPKCHLILDNQSEQEIRCDNCGYSKCFLCGKNTKNHHASCSRKNDNDD